MKSTGTILDKATNVAVILTAVALVGTVIYDRAVPQPRPTSSAQRLVGKTLELPVSANADSAATVLLFVSKNCHFCSESMPFYRRLATLRAPGSNGFTLLAVAPSERETREDAEKYFAEHDVVLDGVAAVSFTRFGVSGTPTIALLDKSKRVLAAWSGRLQAGTEDDVVNAIRKVCLQCAKGT